MGTRTFERGMTPCKNCSLNKHQRCRKMEYCSCNCPNVLRKREWPNQNTHKKFCVRGHEFNIENTRLYDGHHRSCKECEKIRRENNREKIRETARKSYQKNKLEYRLLRRIGSRAHIERVKSIVIKHYGNDKIECVCCGESHIQFLTIDHIIPIGSKNKSERRKTGHNMYKSLIKQKLPLGYQTLCFNCNSGRAINKGICPHKVINTIHTDTKDMIIPNIVAKTKEGEGQFSD